MSVLCKIDELHYKLGYLDVAIPKEELAQLFFEIVSDTLSGTDVENFTYVKIIKTRYNQRNFNLAVWVTDYASSFARNTKLYKNLQES